MKNPIKAVIFDYGGVLSLQPRPEEVRRLRELCALSAEAFERLYFGMRPELDRDSMTGQEYWSRLLEAGGVAPSERLIRSLTARDLAGWTHPNQPLVSWARRLRRGGWRTALLSNMPASFLPALEHRFRALLEFEPRIYSCQVRMIKPEPEIFHHCLKLLEAKPEEVLFLDDNAENAASALRLGIHALHYDSLERIAVELRKCFALPELAAPEPARLKG